MFTNTVLYQINQYKQVDILEIDICTKNKSTLQLAHYSQSRIMYKSSILTYLYIIRPYIKSIQNISKLYRQIYIPKKIILKIRLRNYLAQKNVCKFLNENKKIYNFFLPWATNFVQKWQNSGIYYNCLNIQINKIK